MEYRCAGGLPITVKGSILVPVTADKMLVAATLEYRATAGTETRKVRRRITDVPLSSLKEERPNSPG